MGGWRQPMTRSIAGVSPPSHKLVPLVRKYHSLGPSLHRSLLIQAISIQHSGKLLGGCSAINAMVWTVSNISYLYLLSTYYVFIFPAGE